MYNLASLHQDNRLSYGLRVIEKSFSIIIVVDYTFRFWTWYLPLLVSVYHAEPEKNQEHLVSLGKHLTLDSDKRLTLTSDWFSHQNCVIKIFKIVLYLARHRACVAITSSKRAHCLNQIIDREWMRSPTCTHFHIVSSMARNLQKGHQSSTNQSPDDQKF